MIRAARGLAGMALVLTLPVLPARAELTLCNRTSYVMDAAIGLQKGAFVSARGWFRTLPGQCRRVLEGPLDADLVYVYGRTPAFYGAAPTPASGQIDLCVREGDFSLADARNCPESQRARFAAARPSDTPNGPTVNLAEDADYDDAQARLAGIQRLLVIGGYDATPIDGIAGGRTQAALARFLKDYKLAADAVTKENFFDTLIAAAANPQGSGFFWCNDTPYTVMAALGVVEMGAIVARGWYRIPAGRCLRPDLRDDPHRLYSYAEAVDSAGHPVMRGGTVLSWGGTVPLCTRADRFELSDHKDCAARGLTSAGFTVIDTSRQPTTVVRFALPP
jgi:uncharacterized membrane protein